jgi:kinesin family member 1
MTASGQYEPAELQKSNDQDSGVFRLHLGVQRRLRLMFSHSSGSQLQFKRVGDVKVGTIRELNPSGRLHTLPFGGQISSSLRVLSSKLAPARHESQPVIALTTFEASSSDADLMDRKTPPGHRIVLSLTIGIECERVTETIPFSMDIAVEIHSRNSGQSGWFSIFTPIKQVPTTAYGLFELVLTPAARRGRRNLWKRNSAHVYIRGEETLGGWRPRGVSLVEDHRAFERALAKKVDLEIAKCRTKGPFEQREGSEDELRHLLQYCIDLWRTPSHDTTKTVKHY